MLDLIQIIYDSGRERTLFANEGQSDLVKFGE